MALHSGCLMVYFLLDSTRLPDSERTQQTPPDLNLQPPLSLSPAPSLFFSSPPLSSAPRLSFSQQDFLFMLSWLTLTSLPLTPLPRFSKHLNTNGQAHLPTSPLVGESLQGSDTHCVCVSVCTPKTQTLGQTDIGTHTPTLAHIHTLQDTGIKKGFHCSD